MRAGSPVRRHESDRLKYTRNRSNSYRSHKDWLSMKTILHANPGLSLMGSPGSERGEGQRDGRRGWLRLLGDAVVAVFTTAVSRPGRHN
jgi:hypothetical protein